jgi:hypothetical protein
MNLSKEGIFLLSIATVCVTYPGILRPLTDMCYRKNSYGNFQDLLTDARSITRGIWLDTMIWVCSHLLGPKC